MEEKFTLSVVDQSPVRRGGTATDALRETVQLAKAVEGFGYSRYWVAEHHNTAGFAGTSPEILIGQIAANTNSIRVGSGGVMLMHYSALKVAENFRLLSALYPGRIDLGIGRAPGSDQLTAAALAYPKQPTDINHFPQQVLDVLGYLGDEMDARHPFARVKAGPSEPATPEVWLLGSSDYSARLAAELGMPFSYAHFFGTTSEHGPAIVNMYRSLFQPSEKLKEPKVNVGVRVVCAETTEEAEKIGSSQSLSRVLSAQGRREGLLPPEEASSYNYSPQELAYLKQYRRASVEGDPKRVKAKLLDVANTYQTMDLAIVTNVYNFSDRIRSFELVAEACGVKPQN